MNRFFMKGIVWVILGWAGIIGMSIGEAGIAFAQPPAHAPAHGYRAKYYYYPSRNVYFEPAKGLYFWWSNGDWQVGVNLPGDLSIRLGDHVTLDLDTDRPYIYNADHKVKYKPEKNKNYNKSGPPGHSKKKK